MKCLEFLIYGWFGDDQLKYKPLKNALLSDISISTSAAPTFFPAHYFETKDDNGQTREFNLVDGGLAANNPVSTACRRCKPQVSFFRTFKGIKLFPVKIPFCKESLLPFKFE